MFNKRKKKKEEEGIERFKNIFTDVDNEIDVSFKLSKKKKKKIF